MIGKLIKDFYIERLEPSLGSEKFISIVEGYQYRIGVVNIN